MKVWNVMQQRENFNIIFNTKLDKIVRHDGGVDLFTNHGTEKCDWLIWTPPVSDLLTTLEARLHILFNYHRNCPFLLLTQIPHKSCQILCAYAPVSS